MANLLTPIMSAISLCDIFEQHCYWVSLFLCKMCVVFHHILSVGLKLEIQHYTSYISISVSKMLHFGVESKLDLYLFESVSDAEVVISEWL